ncbi:MAG: hypothetical protein RLN60_04200 [Phycisphaerales bacterium]
MSEEASHVAESPRGLDYRLVVAGVVVVALVALLLVSGPFGSSGRSSDPPSGDAGTAAFDPPPADSEEVTLAMAHQAARALAVSNLERLKAECDGIRESYEHATRVLDGYESDVRRLLEDDRGRAIAGDEGLTRRAYELIRSQQPEYSRELLAGLDRGLAAIERAIQNGLESESSVWSPKGDFQSEVDRIKASVRQTKDAYANARAALSSIASESARVASPSHTSLQSAIDRLAGHLAQEHAAEVSRLRTEAEQARYEHIQELEAKRKRMIEIASSPEAREHLRVLNILTKTEDTMPLSYVSSAYDSASVFYAWSHDRVARALYNRSFSGIPSTHNSYTHIRNVVQELDADARRDFPETDDLWKLFRIFVLSEANQQLFLTNDEVEQFLTEAERSADSARVARLKSYLNSARQPPEPTLP